jgi:hypothetical protein
MLKEKVIEQPIKLRSYLFIAKKIEIFLIFFDWKVLLTFSGKSSKNLLLNIA